MQLSVIIVNYNVKYFIEHCLLSVQRAIQSIQAEVFVVDNLSTDGSVDMIREKFPWVKLIANQENVGFARANNQAVAKARGQYILYLNPDTIIPEDCFEKCITWMDSRPKAGALGCRLIDGKGEFLPESKRGFPSARVAFFKICGLSSLFHTSTYFNRYHLGYLPENETNEVDVLVGCFMFCRKSVIDEVGSFDESYFMYGEDIDLSYKIKRAGYQNIYFPETTVIHYKGESTKKGSLNYVKMFYQAMIIFAKKHFSSSQKGLFVVLIQMAIYMRAVLAFVARVFSIVKLPLLDAGVLLLSLWVMKSLWIQQIKPHTHYANALIGVFFIAYVAIWVAAIFVNGGYDKPYKSTRVMRGMLIGGILSLAIYSLLPENMRFSRGITVLGALLGTIMILGMRKILYWLGVKSVEPSDAETQQVLLIGTAAEEQSIRQLLHAAFLQKNIVGTVSPGNEKEAYQLGVFPHIKQISTLYQVTEIIFAQQTLGFKQIIDTIQQCGPTIDYKIHSIGTDSIIGSNSKNTAGDLYSTEIIYTIDTPESKRNKRFVDIVFALLLIICSPLCMGWVQHPSKYFIQLFSIVRGKKTFVGYTNEPLPPLKPSLFSVYPHIPNFIIPTDNQAHLNWMYAKNYNAWQDVRIILSKWRTI